MLLRVKIIFTISVGFCLKLISSECTNEIYGLYCTNIGINETQSLNLEFKGQNGNITSIFLRNSTGSLTSATFETFPNLEHLDIQFSKIQELTINFPSLHSLYLIKNEGFSNSSAIVQKCCQNLTSLMIQNNSGLNIFEGVFNNTKNLDHLTIQDQNITNLTHGYLKGLHKLTYLDLKHNNIINISGDAFDDLQNLNHLILRNNNISCFNENTFKHLKNLQSLELLNLNLTFFDKHMFENQSELRFLAIPTKLVKRNLMLKNLTDIFSSLESIGLLSKDQNDTDVNNFIQTCKFGGFDVQLMK